MGLDKPRSCIQLSHLAAASSVPTMSDILQIHLKQTFSPQLGMSNESTFEFILILLFFSGEIVSETGMCQKLTHF